MSTLSTHVLDIALGRPAAGVGVRLERVGDGAEPVAIADPGPAAVARIEAIAVASTDADGRVGDLAATDLPSGRYRLVFATGDYFTGTGRDAFHPQVSVEFHIADPDQHYHVPLLVSPYGYTTYRGS